MRSGYGYLTWRHEWSTVRSKTSESEVQKHHLSQRSGRVTIQLELPKYEVEQESRTDRGHLSIDPTVVVVWLGSPRSETLWRLWSDRVQGPKSEQGRGPVRISRISTPIVGTWVERPSRTPMSEVRVGDDPVGDVRVESSSRLLVQSGGTEFLIRTWVRISKILTGHGPTRDTVPGPVRVPGTDNVILDNNLGPRSEQCYPT